MVEPGVLGNWVGWVGFEFGWVLCWVEFSLAQVSPRGEFVVGEMFAVQGLISENELFRHGVGQKNSWLLDKLVRGRTEALSIQCCLSIILTFAVQTYFQNFEVLKFCVPRVFGGEEFREKFVKRGSGEILFWNMELSSNGLFWYLSERDRG